MNDSMIELRETFQAWLQQQVVNLNSYTPEPSQCQKIPIYYDNDDDEESSTPLRDIIISELPLCIVITHFLSTEEPKDSLIMGDEHLDTIPEKESDEFIKSSVENLVPNPSESEDLSNIKSEYDVPVCDDFTTFSNLLFDADDNFSSSDDGSFSDEDVPKEIYLNPLFDEEIISIKTDSHHFNDESDLIESLLNQDYLIISSPKINSLLEEFSGELAHINSISPGINEADFDPEEEIRLIPIYYDNDDNEESSTPLRDIIISELPLCISITLVLSTEEPKDSLIMGDEHLDTILEKESNEFINSSVENLVPNPSESEDLSNIKMTTSHFLMRTNPLFDEEIISIKTDSHHFNAESDFIESLLNQDSLIISSPKIDSLLEEFSSELAHISLLSPGINEADFDSEEEIRLIFLSTPILVEDSDSLMEEIDLFLTLDDSMPPGIKNDDYDSEGDIIFLEEFLSNDSPSLLENKSFY
nr:hypothetical protein [Tanacetum cinerariifolium]